VERNIERLGFDGVCWGGLMVMVELRRMLRRFWDLVRWWRVFVRVERRVYAILLISFDWN